MDLNDIKYFLLNNPKNVLPTDKFFFGISTEKLTSGTPVGSIRP